MRRNMSKTGKRLCSLLLILIMVVVLIPSSLWAEEGEEKESQATSEIESETESVAESETETSAQTESESSESTESTEATQSDEPQPQAGTGSIIGTIWLDENQDGVYDSGESPVADYEVSLYLSSNTNDTVAAVTTDGNGNYTFTDLAPDDYVVGIPLSQEVDGTEYLVPLIGISGDNKFALDETTYDAYTNTISIAADSEAKDYNAGVRLPVGMQTLSVGIQPGSTSSTAYTPNTTVIGFAGYEWWVIGNYSSGVTSPSANSVTLWSKTHNFGSSFFDPTSIYTNDYNGSALQTAMNDLDTSMFTSTKGNNQEKSYVLNRASMDLNAYSYTSATAATDLGASYYGYATPTNQMFWPLSRGEWGTVYGTGGSANTAVCFYGGAEYWLRSPTTADVHAAWIGGTMPYVGTIGANYNYVPYPTTYTVRPAFYLDLSSVIFTSSASSASSKSTATVGSALVDATSWSGDSSQPIKLTMEDNTNLSLTTTTSEITAPPGGTAKFQYSGAQNGTGKSVSVIIYDSTGTNMLYYGRPVDTSTTNTSGTATFDIPSNMTPGDYTLMVFNEQVNAANYTDYASTPVSIPLKILEVTVGLSTNPTTRVYTTDTNNTVNITAVVGNHTGSATSTIEDVEWFRVPVSDTTDYSSSFDTTYAGLTTNKGTITDPGTSELTETFTLTVDKNATYWFKGTVIDGSNTYTAVEAITVDNIYTTTSVSVRGQIAATSSYLYDYETVSGTYGIPYDLDGTTVLTSPSQGYDMVTLSGKTYTMYNASAMKSGSAVPFTLTLDGNFIDPALNTECDGGDIAKYTIVYTVNTGINSTIIGFAGHEWWVIGDNSSGVTSQLSATATSSVTLWSKDYDFATSMFNPQTGLTGDNEYDGSTLQNYMLYTVGVGMFTSGSNGNAQEEDYLIERDAASIDQDSWTYVNGVNDTNDNDYWGYGSVSSDQTFWPLSKGEWETVGTGTSATNLRSYSAPYWLRSPDSNSMLAAWVVAASGTYSVSDDINNGAYGARPAFYLDMSAVLYTSAASGSDMKPVTAGTSLVAVTSPSGAIKLTMEETDTNKLALSSSTTTVTASPGATASINYSGAITGTNKSVSIMICDPSTGESLYYGRLVDLSISGAASSGTATFTIPSGLALGDDYILKVFNEEVNDANITDYASTPVEVPLQVRSTVNLSYNSNVNTYVSTMTDTPTPAETFTIGSTVTVKAVDDTTVDFTLRGVTVPPGYEFDCWNTEPDGSGTSYDPDNSTSNYFTITANTVLYARWKPIEPSITIEKYGDQDGTTQLAGAQFTVERETSAGVWEYYKYDAGTSSWGTAGSASDSIVTTTSSGYTLSNLPEGTYRFTEVAPPTSGSGADYTILREPFEVTVPLVTTTDYTGSPYNYTGSWQTDGTDYYYYNLTYQVTDAATLYMPTAGSGFNQIMYLAIGLFVLAITAVIFVLTRRRKVLKHVMHPAPEKTLP